MRSRVSVTVGGPSVRLYVPSIDSSNGANWFANGRPADRRYSSIAAGAVLQARRRSAVNAGSVHVESRRRRLNTYLFALLYAVDNRQQEQDKLCCSKMDEVLDRLKRIESEMDDYRKIKKSICSSI